MSFGWKRMRQIIVECPYVIRVVLFGVAYYLGARLGLFLSFPPNNIGMLWPPNAILLTVLLMTPPRLWWGYLVMAIPAELAADMPMGIRWDASLIFLSGDYVEVGVAVILIRTVQKTPLRFVSAAEWLTFFASAVVIGPAAGSLVGACAGGCDVMDPAYWERVRAWLLSDALTHVSLTPFLVILCATSCSPTRRGQSVSLFERSVLVAGLVGVSYVLFGNEPMLYAHTHFMLYLPVPILLWAALRPGPLWSAVSATVITLAALWGASRGQGLLITTLEPESLVDLQLFLLLSLGPISLLSVVIKERKAAQEALRESEEKYRLLVDHAGDMVVKVDPEGHFLYVSPEYCRVFGVQEEELLGSTSLPLVHKEDRAATEQAMASLHRPPYRCYIEHRAMTCKGWRWIAWRNTAVLNDAGQVDAIVGVGRDIQALKDAEAERAQLRERVNRAEKLEALKLLAGGVAHDLNNSLSGMVSFPDLLLLDLPEDSPLRQPLQLIRDSGFRAAAVVRDITGLVRAARMNTTFIPVNVSRILSEYLASTDGKDLHAAYPDVAFRTNLEMPVLNVIGDPVQLRVAFANVLFNAAEAVGGGGVVAIAAANCYLEEALAAYEEIPAGEYVVVKVATSCQCVADEDLPRLFEPFFTRKVLGLSGTGLGLPIVWNTIHEHGGFVDLHNTERGTVFVLYLPASRAVVPEVDAVADVHEYMGHGEVILVVDDDPAQRQIVKHILQRLNYRVELAEDGASAIEHVRSTHVDLVLLDMIMPKGLNGRETFMRIKDIQPDVKAVVASGFAHADGVKAMFEVGVRRYIEKPYTVARLGRELYDELHGDVG